MRVTATSASADRFICRLLLILIHFQKFRGGLDAALLQKFEQISDQGTYRRPLAPPRRGRRTALTFPDGPPPQKN